MSLEVDQRWTIGKLRAVIAETLGVVMPSAQSVLPSSSSDEAEKTVGSSPAMGTTTGAGTGTGKGTGTGGESVSVSEGASEGGIVSTSASASGGASGGARGGAGEGGTVDDPLRNVQVGVSSTPPTPSSSSSLRLFKNNPKGAELKDDTVTISASGFYNGMSIFVAYGKVVDIHT